MQFTKTDTKISQNLSFIEEGKLGVEEGTVQISLLDLRSRDLKKI